MKPVLCVRNDGDDTLGISALALERSGVPVVRLDGFESAVRFSELDQIGGAHHPSLEPEKGWLVGSIVAHGQAGRHPATPTTQVSAMAVRRLERSDASSDLRREGIVSRGEAAEGVARVAP